VLPVLALGTPAVPAGIHFLLATARLLQVPVCGIVCLCNSEQPCPGSAYGNGVTSGSLFYPSLAASQQNLPCALRALPAVTLGVAGPLGIRVAPQGVQV
jgi:hypothetical protein